MMAATLLIVGMPAMLSSDERAATVAPSAVSVADSKRAAVEDEIAGVDALGGFTVPSDGLGEDRSAATATKAKRRHRSTTAAMKRRLRRR